MYNTETFVADSMKIPGSEKYEQSKNETMTDEFKQIEGAGKENNQNSSEWTNTEMCILQDLNARQVKKSGEYLSKQCVHELLMKAGVEQPGSVNPCLKSGIQKGFYKIDGPDSLDQVILRGKCGDCRKETIDVTIRMCLYQLADGSDYISGGFGGAIACENFECWGQYITGLCEGEPTLDCGKHHYHCTECPGFGKCIGDCHTTHCHERGKHYSCYDDNGEYECEHCQDDNKCPSSYGDSSEDSDELEMYGDLMDGSYEDFGYVYKQRAQIYFKRKYGITFL